MFAARPNVKLGINFFFNSIEHTLFLIEHILYHIFLNITILKLYFEYLFNKIENVCSFKAFWWGDFSRS